MRRSGHADSQLRILRDISKDGGSLTSDDNLANASGPQRGQSGDAAAVHLGPACAIVAQQCALIPGTEDIFGIASGDGTKALGGQAAALHVKRPAAAVVMENASAITNCPDIRCRASPQAEEIDSTPNGYSSCRDSVPAQHHTAVPSQPGAGRSRSPDRAQSPTCRRWQSGARKAAAIPARQDSATTNCQNRARLRPHCIQVRSSPTQHQRHLRTIPAKDGVKEKVILDRTSLNSPTAC